MEACPVRPEACMSRTRLSRADDASRVGVDHKGRTDERSGKEERPVDLDHEGVPWVSGLAKSPNL